MSVILEEFLRAVYNVATISDKTIQSCYSTKNLHGLLSIPIKCEVATHLQTNTISNNLFELCEAKQALKSYAQTSELRTIRVCNIKGLLLEMVSPHAYNVRGRSQLEKIFMSHFVDS